DFDSPTSGVPVSAALVAMSRRGPVILRADYFRLESPNRLPAFFRELDRRYYFRTHYRLAAQEFAPARVWVGASPFRCSQLRPRVSASPRRCPRSHRETACDRGRIPRRSRSLIEVEVPGEFSVCAQPLSRCRIASHRTSHWTSHRTSAVYPD